MSKFLALMLVILVFCSCTSFSKRTPSEQESGYTYVPLDPFSVQTSPGSGCERFSQLKDPNTGLREWTPGFAPPYPYRALLDSLPDNAVRMSVERFNVSGSVTYGPVGIGTEDESYRVTVDYINADTTNIPVWLTKKAQLRQTGIENAKYDVVDPLAPLPNNFQQGTEIYSIIRETNSNVVLPEYARQINIPVYVGIGLRVTANVNILKGNVNIAGLGAIGAEAEAENLRGSLVVQTLGVNGKSIAAALPIQSELNRTTAQNAIVAVGAIKALLYEKDTVKAPRVVGIYLPFPGGKPLVNAIISEISSKPIVWARPCTAADD